MNKVAFTGSTVTGRSVMRAGANTIKRVSLELGGKSPSIVFADADLDQAVIGSVFGIYLAQGEVCSAGSRVLVERSVYDDFVQRFAAKARAIRLGLRSAIEEVPVAGARHPRRRDPSVPLRARRATGSTVRRAAAGLPFAPGLQ